MHNEKQAVRDFLKRQGSHYEDIDFIKCTDDFIAEMEKGLCEKSSLPMIPTYLSIDNINVKNEKVVVIDAGGTNFRSALVCFNEHGNPEIKGFSKHRMPGSDVKMSADEFFNAMARLIEPIVGESDKIGFCFSYPLEMTKEKDGRILPLTKELKVDGAEGMLVGENLTKALGKHKKTVLLNDAAAVLLGGFASYHQRRFSSFAGFILGTGINSAYVEQCSDIKKDSEICAASGNMIINMESGCFDKAPTGIIDETLTKSTRNPESSRFEKMISGAYLGMNVLYTLKAAGEEGLLSHEYAERLRSRTNFDGAELYDFLTYPYGNGDIASLCENERDRLLTYFFAENVSERVAKLAAINLAAVVKKSGVGQSPLEPVCILVEGSTYYKARFIKDRISYYIRKYLNDEMQLYAELMTANDITLIGSAIAGLL